MPRYTRVRQAHRPAFNDMDDLQLLLFRQHEVISRKQAMHYLSQGAIRHQLLTGHWRVAERGVYVTHTGPITDAQRLVIASLAVGAGTPALIAGVTALTMMGLRGYGSATVHVLLSWRRRDLTPPHWVAVHRTRRLDRSDMHANASPPYTLQARSLIDAAQWARTDDEAVAVIAAGYQQRLVAGDEIAQALLRVPVARRGGLIRSAATDAAGGSHSLPEIEFVRGCRDGRLPEPSRQVVRTDATGRRRYLDAYFEKYGVHVEIDGGQHTDARQWWADMRRQNELWVAGDRVLRFPAFMIRLRPHEWVPQLRAALIAGGWQPPAE